MHGQKKRRKRSLDGSIAIDGVRFSWRLLSEPQWTSEHGYKGLCISVRTEDERHRELILEYPFPRNLLVTGCPRSRSAQIFSQDNRSRRSQSNRRRLGAGNLEERRSSSSCPDSKLRCTIRPPNHCPRPAPQVMILGTPLLHHIPVIQYMRSSLGQRVCANPGMRLGLSHTSLERPHASVHGAGIEQG